jgi:Fanconi anemia group M protein
MVRKKERKMEYAIKSLQENNILTKKEETEEQSKLDKFVRADKLKPDETIKIFADSREQGPLVDYLYETGVQVSVGPLKAGDFILSEAVGCERKEVSDFVASLIDGRLFEQAKKLKENFSRPAIVVEGEFAKLFSARNVNPSAIFGAIASFVFDWDIPILYTSSELETAQLLLAIARREQLEKKKEVSVRCDVKPKTFAEQQQFFVEGLPQVGPSLAKALLRQFRSPKNIINATIDELQKIEGIGDKKADIIKRLLEKEFNEFEE